MKKGYLILLFLIIPCISVFSQKTKVFILGTVHSELPNYRYQDIANIIFSYNPDIIGVEIRPQDFRELEKHYTMYPDEMLFCTLYCEELSIPVIPIDWYTDENLNIILHDTDAILNDENNKLLYQVFVERMRKSPIINSFTKKYGIFRPLTENEQISNDTLQKVYTYQFLNSEEVQDYLREQYLISESVFGDSIFNRWHLERNTKMFELINDVISLNQGKRIIVLTGLDHKHFFDDKLKSIQNIEHIQMNDLSIKRFQVQIDVQTYLNHKLHKSK